MTRTNDELREVIALDWPAEVHGIGAPHAAELLALRELAEVVSQFDDDTTGSGWWIDVQEKLAKAKEARR